MSCFGGGEELIYLVEITVERLRLKEEKFKEEFGDDPPLIKIKFLEFPVFEIGPRPKDACACFEREPYCENVGLVYATGKSCLFVMKPNALVRSMRMKPLIIGVFRGDETFPIAEGSIALSGCLCDQVAMAKNDAEHRPAPFEMFGNYVLLDPGKTVAGNIRIYFRLTLFGEYLISNFQLNQNSVTFKNDFDGEIQVFKVPEDDDYDVYSCDPEEGECEDQCELDCESYRMESHCGIVSMKSETRKSMKSVKSIKSEKSQKSQNSKKSEKSRKSKTAK